ncbi:MAG: tRNA lysidine(34) synthetase TilS [Burkholderiales bacterium]
MTPPCIAVAYSGGRDSSALLHATLAAAAALDISVAALHVHHGLSSDANAWLSHCERQCRRWAARGRRVVFDHRRLDGKPARGESVEAWARRERYLALHEMAGAHGAAAVLLAHHRLDQAETLLLQALRGAGVAGLAAMPQVAERDGISWLRPWLGVDPAQIGAYARRHRISHIEDDSNTDPRYARNRLRLQVWPALAAAFPDAQAALAASATWAQEARACADALAAIDIVDIADRRGLDVNAWKALPPARCSNALRAWLKSQTGKAATSAEVQRLLDELPASNAPGRWPLGRFELRRYRGRLVCGKIAPDATRDSAQKPRVTTLAVIHAGNYALAGWGGVLRATRVTHGGVALAALAQLRLVERLGGEQFQPAPNRPSRSLKKQYQSHGVPAWERQGPLFYCGDSLIFVPGLGIDARAVAAAGEAQLSLAWIADPD